MCRTLSETQIVGFVTHRFKFSSGEEHYNIISALHKSMRGSDDSAALYWLARMLEGGETPLYVARRLVRFASEDIGNDRLAYYSPALEKWGYTGFTL